MQVYVSVILESIDIGVIRRAKIISSRAQGQNVHLVKVSVIELLLFLLHSGRKGHLDC